MFLREEILRCGKRKQWNRSEGSFFKEKLAFFVMRGSGEMKILVGKLIVKRNGSQRRK